MLGCVVPSLALMVTSEQVSPSPSPSPSPSTNTSPNPNPNPNQMERNMTRLVIEAVNSALTFVLLWQLVRYHRLSP